MKPFAASFLIISSQTELSIYAYVILPVEVIFIKLMLYRVAYFGNKGVSVSLVRSWLLTVTKKGDGVDRHRELRQPAEAKNGNLDSRSAKVDA